MRRLLSIALVAAACGIVLARGGAQAPQPASGEGEKKLIDLKSDLMGPIAPGDSVIFLVRNFAAQHNGAVITCDSAVRYSDMRIEFFGHVLINKNTTYIYGDRALYDGDRNEAEVFSDLVKVVDGDAVLYTYKFLFNTKDNIGYFGGGGVMTNRENVLESVRGYYYADTKELIAVERVEMRNDEYELKGDSVVYNMATDNAFFFEKTNIWNTDGDYLYADRGSYDKADSLYIVTRNGYVLTEKQEMWSDSIDFFRARNHIVLRQDIQIDDTEHKTLAFGDYGEYWKEPGNALLTRRPAVVSYDREQGDSLFMRSDSIFLFTVNALEEERRKAAAQVPPTDTTLVAGPAGVDSLGRVSRPEGRPGVDSTRVNRPGGADSIRFGAETDAVDSMRLTPPAGSADSTRMPYGADSLGMRPSPPDSLAVNAADTVKLTAAERKAQVKEAARKAKAEKKAAEAKRRKEEGEVIAKKRQEKATAKLLAQKEREEARLAARRVKAESKLRARQARAKRKGKPIPMDSTALQQLDSLIVRNAVEQDSLLALLGREWAADSIELFTPRDTTDSVALPRDSIYRLIKGFRDVRIYRSDFQAVCDSMVAISTDSTIHLYIDPVLWNESNQITSEVMDIFTENQQIVRAEFVGEPMMVAQLDTVHYNQVAGKQMTAFFHHNAIYRNDVNGNAQTIYYMTDGEPPEITGMGVIGSGDCTFYIEDKQVVSIVYRSNPDWHIYPMDKIPADQSLYLKGFKWEGARRPSQTDVFDRGIRPSQRGRKSSLRHPEFPIRRRIDEHRARLVEQRRWSDRMDQVDDATVEWMRALGFEVGQPREGAPGTANTDR